MWRNQKNGVVGKVKLQKKGILCYSQTDRRPEKIQPLSITQKTDIITGKLYILTPAIWRNTNSSNGSATKQVFAGFDCGMH